MGFLALSLEPDTALVAAAAEQLDIRATVVTTPDEVLAPLGVQGVPATVFVDRDGTLVAAETGPKSLASLRKQARALLPGGG